MNINRRGFLHALAAGVAIVSAPILLDASGVALVAPTTLINPHQKYIDALALFDKCVEINRQLPLIELHSKFDGKNYMGKDISTDLHSAVDSLFEYLHTNFAIPENTAEDCLACSHVLGRFKINNEYLPMASIEDFRKIPPTVIETVWPIAAMRFILRDYGMNINHRKLTQFKTFHERYGRLVIQD